MALTMTPAVEKRQRHVTLATIRCTDCSGLLVTVGDGPRLNRVMRALRGQHRCGV